ncbi:MAG TPA: glycerophosphodiester phosphodiesterase [Bacteroidales bacterium]|nr:glycerophosphodiester phosphodiesterase [Bacteroidales bacterium]
MNQNNQSGTGQMTDENRKVRDFVVDQAIIAHRGTTYWAPEETEAAFRWARNTGADYLEVDIQRSKDGVLLALHDNNLNRTTDCEVVFPKDTIYQAGNYSYEELMILDAGTWFNQNFPDRARLNFSAEAQVEKTNQKAFSFSGLDISGDLEPKNALVHPDIHIFVGGKQYISTLEDVLMMAKGWRLARDNHGKRLYDKIENEGKTTYRFYYVKDENDLGHRPGVYIETKEPELYPEVEIQLSDFLSKVGWNIAEKPSNPKEPFYKSSKVNSGNTNGKIVLQTFSPKSLENLNQQFKGKVPLCFLLWKGDENFLQSDSVSYKKNIDFAIVNQAHFIGPSIGGVPNNYTDLLEPWQAEMIHSSGMKIHAYSFDTEFQTEKYASRSDAMFTNRSELTIAFYKNRDLKSEIPKTDALQILKDLRY